MGSLGWRGWSALAAATVLTALGAAPASAAITATRDAGAIAAAIDDETGGAVTGASFDQIPPLGNPAGTLDANLALFPLRGADAAIISTGDVLDADRQNDSGATSSNNGGDGGSHSGPIVDLVTVRVDLQVPAETNCLTMEFRFLSEEFPEFVGSEFNDGFLVEIDETNFEVGGNGNVTAPNNIAFDPDGFEVTVNSTGISSDNALGTTYDGGSAILRATTPVTPGAHPLFISVYDINDAIYDTAVLFDNLRLRNAKPENCKRGAAPSPKEGRRCAGQVPTMIASAGVAVGTPGDDVILGTGGDDLIRGRGGDDLICGLRGRDTLSGQSGRDVIAGGPGSDRIFGGLRKDRLRGNRGNDLLAGRRGNDGLHGNKGDDRLRGGPGIDRCRGGTGKDRMHNCER